MEIRQLRYFLAVAAHRNFTRAAEASFVSQPALSQQIRALERQVGVPLFDRLSTGVELTSAGVVLRQHAERVMRELESARTAVDEVVGEVRGELSLAAVHTANGGGLLAVLARFHAEYPKVRVRLHELRPESVVERVLAGKANLGITYLPIADAALEVEPLWQEELVLVVPGEHPLAGREIRLEELAGQHLIVPPDGFPLRDGIDRVLATVPGSVEIVAEISGREGLFEAVRAGLGLTLLPLEWAGREDLMRDLALARLTPAARRGIVLIRHVDRHVCLATRAFLEVLRGDAGRIPGGISPLRAAARA